MTVDEVLVQKAFDILESSHVAIVASTRRQANRLWCLILDKKAHGFTDYNSILVVRPDQVEKCHLQGFRLKGDRNFKIIVHPDVFMLGLLK